MKQGKRIATVKCTAFPHADDGQVLLHELETRQKEDFVDLE